MKICRGCELEKSVSEFPVRNDRSGRLRPYCKLCDNQIKRSRYKAHKRNSPFKHRCARAKTRASRLGVAFDLSPEYLKSIWTGVCPVFGTKLLLHSGRANLSAAELDRFYPEKGYVQGNVNWLSRKANRLKDNITLEELNKLTDWMSKNV